MIGGYNQGVGIPSKGKNGAWLNMLTTTAKSTKSNRSTTIKYALAIMHDSSYLEMPRRDYYFQGGLGFDVNGDGEIEDVIDDPDTTEDETLAETTVPWCFKWSKAD